MGISSKLGKYVANLAKKDKSGYTKSIAEDLSTFEKIGRMKKAELEDIAETGTSSEKHYAKAELERRSENKETVRSLKDRQSKGELTEKQVKNRTEANVRKLPSSDSLRDTVRKEYDRATEDMSEFRKGGMAKKKPTAAKKPVAAKKPMAAKKATSAKKPVVKKK